MILKKSYNLGKRPHNLLLTALASSLVLSACGGGSDKSDEQATADTVAPVITLQGESNVTLPYNNTYTDAGATATDDVDGTVTVTSSGSVDSSTIGEYIITYTATDTANNSTTETRTVTVVDVTAPTITVSGDSNTEIFVGETYTDAGATATDDVDATITVTSSDDIDESVAGTYTVTYTAIDAAGNTAIETRTVNVITPTLSGTAAAGAAIVGTVTVKDSLGATKSELIEADGSYNVDVTGMTPPFRLRAEGTVGGKVYKLHSYAEQANTEGAVNITPFTDLIVANTAKQLAESFFEENTPLALDSDELDAQEDALQDKLQSVFTALGLDTAINLLNTSFSADHSGLDAALDVINIETDPDSNVATITNLIENTSIDDDITAEEADDVKIVVADPDALTGTVDETIAIANVFKTFSASFADGLPTPASIEDLLGQSFLHGDQARAQFLTDITTDPSLIGLLFSSVSIRDLDKDAGTATVDFNVTFNGITELEPESWQVSKDDQLGWQLLGNQLIVEADTLTFHCNDYDGTDNVDGGCGLNASFYDNDFTNNGTANDAPLASATIEIIDAKDGTVKDIVYFGNADYNGPGELSVYNQTQQQFTGDYANFDNTDGGVDPSIFEVGDIIRYKVYAEALDITTPNQPYIPSDQALVSFDRTLIYLPETTGRYPALSAQSISAIENFDPETDLTLSWSVQSGTVVESIRIEVFDNQGNHFDIEDEAISHDATSTELETTALIDTITNDVNFDETNYTLLVRVYSIVPATGQSHSTDYRVHIGGDNGSGGGDGTGGGHSGLTCNTESPWDDLNDKPLTFYSIDDFNTVVADCAATHTIPSFSASALANVSWYVDDEVIAFDATGQSGVVTGYGDDEILGTDDDETFYLTVTDFDTNSNIVEFSFSETQGGAVRGRDLVHVFEITTSANTNVYHARVLWEDYQWAESDQTNQDSSHQGAEIYHEVYATDASYYNQSGGHTSAITCHTESDWDDVNDKPTEFYSLDDFDASVADCANQSSLPDFSKSDLANITWYYDDERLQFDSTGSSFVITTFGDDGALGGGDDETYYGVVSDYATNVLEFGLSFTAGGDIVGTEHIRVLEETTFGGKSIYNVKLLWEFYQWTESDGGKAVTSHQGAELVTRTFAVDVDFDFNAYYNQ